MSGGEEDVRERKEGYERKGIRRAVCLVFSYTSPALSVSSHPRCSHDVEPNTECYMQLLIGETEFLQNNLLASCFRKTGGHWY